MGQLEKYGLYVLCLVIFLILGVAIWGGDPASVAPANGKELAKAAAQPGPDPRRDAGDPAATADKHDTKLIDGFFAAAPRAADDKKDEKKGDEKKDEKKPDGARADAKPDAAQVAALAATPREYMVRKGDRLEEIAEKELGSRQRWREIVAINPGLDPNNMKSDKPIKIPAKAAAKDPSVKPGTAHDAQPVAKAESTAKPPVDAKLARPSSYTAKKGDTLVSISRKFYGDDKHVDAIWAANKKQMPSKNDLHERTVLALPGKP